MINEKFTCVAEEFTEANEGLGIVGAIYTSQNFRLTLGYGGGYNKDKADKRFKYVV